jgi:hypothetical protein
MQWLKYIAMPSLNSLSWLFTLMQQFTLFYHLYGCLRFQVFQNNIWERFLLFVKSNLGGLHTINCIWCCNNIFLWFSGLTYLVYPGAVHTRFEHSLGVYSLAGKAINNLKTYQVCVASIWILKLTEMLEIWSVKVKVLFYFDREKNLELIMLTCRL